ncbi:hypothetical protein DBV15_12161, partial [Temnothorax longispinosus]
AIALIFNHSNYDNILGLLPRSGTDKDCEDLKKTLEKLGFEVRPFDNFTHKKINQELQRAAEIDHTDSDCILITILTHDSEGRLWAYDTSYEANCIWYHFTAEKCQSLAGKPKLFIIQACQRNKSDPGCDVDIEMDGLDTISAPTLRIPIHVDFLIVFASTPGFASHRNNTDYVLQVFSGTRHCGSSKAIENIEMYRIESNRARRLSIEGPSLKNFRCCHTCNYLSSKGLTVTVRLIRLNRSTAWCDDVQRLLQVQRDLHN